MKEDERAIEEKGISWIQQTGSGNKEVWLWYWRAQRVEWECTATIKSLILQTKCVFFFCFICNSWMTRYMNDCLVFSCKSSVTVCIPVWPYFDFKTSPSTALGQLEQRSNTGETIPFVWDDAQRPFLRSLHYKILFSSAAMSSLSHQKVPFTLIYLTSTLAEGQKHCELVWI